MVIICTCGYTGRHPLDPGKCPRCGAAAAARPDAEDPLVHVAQDGTRFDRLMHDAPPEVRHLFAMLLYPPDGDAPPIRFHCSPCQFAHGRWWVTLGNVEIRTIHPPEVPELHAPSGGGPPVLDQLLDQLQDLEEVARLEVGVPTQLNAAQLDLKAAIRERLRKVAELVDEVRALSEADQWRPGEPLPPRRPRPADDF